MRIMASRANHAEGQQRGLKMTDAYDLIIPEVDGFNHSVVVDGLLGFYAAVGKDDPVIAAGACAD